MLATTRMIGLMEVAASRAMKGLLRPGQLSAGVGVNVKHLAATPVGVEVKAVARFLGMQGKLDRFKVEASDPGGLIGEGEHTRAIVSTERLVSGAMSRTQEEALNEPTARAVVERMLNCAVEMGTDARNPRGCFLVQGALSCGESAMAAREELGSRRAAAEAALRRRLKRAKDEGDLTADADPADLARYVGTVLQGHAVQAAGGASRAELRRVIETALRAWPS